METPLVLVWSMCVKAVIVLDTHTHTHVLSRRKAAIIPECERRKWSRERGHIQLGCRRQTRRKKLISTQFKAKITNK